MSNNKPSERRNFIQATIASTPGISRREIAALLGQKPRDIEHLLRSLVVSGLVLRHDPEGANASSQYWLVADRDKIPSVSIFEHCRRNWRGYLIHKVFGAGGAVRL